MAARGAFDPPGALRVAGYRYVSFADGKEEEPIATTAEEGLKTVELIERIYRSTR